MAATHLARAGGRYELDGRSYTADEFTGLLAGLTEPQQRQILRDNAAKLFGVG